MGCFGRHCSSWLGPMPSVFYKEDILEATGDAWTKCSEKRMASSSVNVTGSTVREDFTYEVTFDFKARVLAGAEGERCRVDLCRCLANMSKG